jgi:glycosyltransferase involved in cell wall biosynthesis
MGHPKEQPELSVIVAARNETGELPALFANLAGQQGIVFELIVADGDSTDGTAAMARELGESAPFVVTILEGEANRGAQLDAAIAASRGSMLLILHADSVFPDPMALRKALDTLDAASAPGKTATAGHCRLRFRHSSLKPSLPFFFYEAKACLDRTGCTHGDQGLLFSRSVYGEAGPFANDRPMLAETEFAERVRKIGRWLLLPMEIQTSARRFEKEGLKERQTLNSLICNAAALDWEEFFDKIPALYRHHDESDRLDLAPIFKGINRLIKMMPRQERSRFWYHTGVFVRENAWQIPFFLDIRNAFRQGVEPWQVKPCWLALHDRIIAPLIANPAGNMLAGFLTWCWFRFMCYGFSSNKKNSA